MAVQRETGHESKSAAAVPKSGATPLSPEESELEQYGVWVKEGPQDIIDLDKEIAPEGSDGDSLTSEEEELLGSLEESAAEEGPGPMARPEEIELENLDQDFSFDLDEEHLELDELPDLTEPPSADLTIERPARPSNAAAPGAAPLPTRDEAPVDLAPIDDVSAFEADLAESSEEEEPMGIPEGSQSILQKIEEDLLTIKQELAVLKSEISSLRGGTTPAQGEERQKEGEPGFFAEDEDETIALTGDELDNILNTADITEETGEPTAVPEEPELVSETSAPEIESLIDKDNILELEEEPSFVTAPTIELDEEEIPIEIPEEEIVLEELSEPEPAPQEPEGLERIEDLDEIEIALPESEEAAGIEELPEIKLDEDELQLGDIEIGEEFDLSASEKEALETETEEPESLLEEMDLPAIGEQELEPVEAEPLDDGGLEDFEPLAAFEEEPTPAPAAGPEQGKVASQPNPESGNGSQELSDDLKGEIKSILKYMDQLLEALPEDKIEEFARSEYFEVYKKLFDELGLTT